MISFHETFSLCSIRSWRWRPSVNDRHRRREEHQVKLPGGISHVLHRTLSGRSCCQQRAAVSPHQWLRGGRRDEHIIRLCPSGVPRGADWGHWERSVRVWWSCAVFGFLQGDEADRACLAHGREAAWEFPRRQATTTFLPVSNIPMYLVLQCFMQHPWLSVTLYREVQSGWGGEEREREWGRG